jgi:hypothetical protein
MEAKSYFEFRESFRIRIFMPWSAKNLETGVDSDMPGNVFALKAVKVSVKTAWRFMTRLSVKLSMSSLLSHVRMI